MIVTVYYSEYFLLTSQTMVNFYKEAMTSLNGNSNYWHISWSVKNNNSNAEEYLGIFFLVDSCWLVLSWTGVHLTFTLSKSDPPGRDFCGMWKAWKIKRSWEKYEINKYWILIWHRLYMKQKYAYNLDLKLTMKLNPLWPFDIYFVSENVIFIVYFWVLSSFRQNLPNPSNE